MTPIWTGKCLQLLLCMSVLSQTEGGSKRKKREWIIPARKLMENVDYTKQEFIAKIWSDKHTQASPLEYSLTGRGADIEPYNLFIVNPQNGLVRITGILDREEISQYDLKGLGQYRNSSLAEGEVQLKVQVLDQNDNPPKFSFSQGSVKEGRKIGTPVMQIKAEDADEPGTSHTKIAYSIVKQIPEESGPMFSINRDTGKLYVKQHTLDRETLDSYTLIVQGVDMDGAPNGNTGTGTVQIKVLDINDNVPTLEQDEYTGYVDEGAADVVVMRIKALDKDLENTENWLAHFEIIEGNEDGVFSIETDPKTNEGLLKLVKPVDYEKVKQLNLGLVISNVAPFANGTEKSLDSDKQMGGTGSGLRPEKPDKRPLTQEGKRYSVKVFVNNLSDGIFFSPSVKLFSVSEDPEKIKVPEIIGSFPAIDGDTEQIAKNIRYAKGYDPDNWLSINEQTSEIKLVKTPDRESTFLVNGTYFAKIICITQDVPPKTATGTIALQVEDSNDHCPKLTSTYQSVCSDTNIINVTAFDEDVNPNGEPYKFVLIEEETRGKWEIVPVNGTTVSFHAQELLWPGFYELTVEIFDVKGLGCEDRQKLQVEVCTCDEDDACVAALRAAKSRVSSVKVGVPAIGLLVAGMALLMLVPMLLLFCQCGAVNEFMELPFDTKEHLISYHTEGKGEDKEVPILSFSEQQTKSVAGNPGSNVSTMLSHGRGQVMGIGTMFEYQNNTLSCEHHRSHTCSSLFRHEVQDTYGEIALPDNYLRDYFIQKVRYGAGNPPLTDSLLVYDHEGQDSPVGSLGCCSLLESSNSLAFLNDLGPKFMALAEICSAPEPCSPLSEDKINGNVLDTNITSVDHDSKPVTPLPDQDKADTEALNNNLDNLSTMHTNQIQLVQQNQPLYYLVEHQVPTTVILAERPAYGAYLINGSAATGGLNLSIPESPTLSTVWLQGNQSQFQHHELPGSEKVVLVQNECNETPTLLSQAHTNNMVQGIDSGLIQDCSTLDPGSPTQAQAELQIQDSSLKFSEERGSENVFMLRHDIVNLSEPEDALEELNITDELVPPHGKGQENMVKFLKDDTKSMAQNIAPFELNGMPSILPDILQARPTTEEVLAKANVIQKELEQTLLIARPPESAANIVSENNDLSGKETDDLASKILKDSLEEPNPTERDAASALPPDTELNENEQDKMPVYEFPTSTSSDFSTKTVKETVLDTHVPSVVQLIRKDATLTECSIKLNKTDKINANDSVEFAVIENTSSLMTQEVIPEQSLTHELEKEREFVDSQPVMEDLTVTEETDLNYASEQELAVDFGTTVETPQDISVVNLMVDREVGAAIDFQATSLTKEIKRDLHPQNLEDIKKNEHGLHEVNQNVSQLEEDEVSVSVLNMHFGMTKEVRTE
ncbi:desmoglein-2 isoform X1 [Astyanax mexicanus]|uniref:Desmoglein-2 isoform X1 n=1 Tax=Astyanax mexicanus TaxID=7994 RepID=A0A8T2MMV0_ASTMX|nr:desmoglein-2 isoform X1 [Astyanax mexicanus]